MAAIIFDGTDRGRSHWTVMLRAKPLARTRSTGGSPPCWPSRDRWASGGVGMSMLPMLMMRARGRHAVPASRSAGSSAWTIQNGDFVGSRTRSHAAAGRSPAVHPTSRRRLFTRMSSGLTVMAANQALVLPGQIRRNATHRTEFGQGRHRLRSQASGLAGTDHHAGPRPAAGRGRSSSDASRAAGDQSRLALQPEKALPDQRYIEPLGSSEPNALSSGSTRSRCQSSR